MLPLAGITLENEWLPLPENELPAECSREYPELVEIFESLVDSAKTYNALTGRYQQILGELYAEIMYSI
jgi:hypothetical protein